jgi:hypothetical protein
MLWELFLQDQIIQGYDVLLDTSCPISIGAQEAHALTLLSQDHFLFSPLLREGAKEESLEQ